MRAIIRDPLIHFVLLGAGLFFTHAYLRSGPVELSPQTIHVDRQTLLQFMQYRSRAFDAASFGALIDSLSEVELQQLIDQYVREEALYREAKALRLDQNDYVVRLRLIQQLEFIQQGFVPAHVQLTEEELRRYYEAHRSKYQLGSKVTFTHVFFSSARHGDKVARELAEAALRKLNRAQVPFADAPGYGERFLYHVNYVDREADEVASHFGKPMQMQLFELEPNEKLWRGPFESAYGSHLVLLTRREAGRLPALDEVRARVEQDARRATLDKRFEDSIQSILRGYEVDVQWDDLHVQRPNSRTFPQ